MKKEKWRFIINEIATTILFLLALGAMYALIIVLSALTGGI